MQTIHTRLCWGSIEIIPSQFTDATTTCTISIGYTSIWGGPANNGTNRHVPTAHTRRDHTLSTVNHRVILLLCPSCRSQNAGCAWGTCFSSDSRNGNRQGGRKHDVFLEICCHLPKCSIEVLCQQHGFPCGQWCIISLCHKSKEQSRRTFLPQ